jgi:hypothetical protein
MGKAVRRELPGLILGWPTMPVIEPVLSLAAPILVSHGPGKAVISDARL